MLKVFVLQQANFHMTIEEAQAYDQRPFRSMLIQKWIAFKPGRGFHVTQAGRDAWHEFQTTTIQRNDPTRPAHCLFRSDSLQVARETQGGGVSQQVIIRFWVGGQLRATENDTDEEANSAAIFVRLLREHPDSMDLPHMFEVEFLDEACRKALHEVWDRSAGDGSANGTRFRKARFGEALNGAPAR